MKSPSAQIKHFSAVNRIVLISFCSLKFMTLTKPHNFDSDSSMTVHHYHHRYMRCVLRVCKRHRIYGQTHINYTPNSSSKSSSQSSRASSFSLSSHSLWRSEWLPNALSLSVSTNASLKSDAVLTAAVRSRSSEVNAKRSLIKNNKKNSNLNIESTRINENCVLNSSNTVNARLFGLCVSRIHANKQTEYGRPGSVVNNFLLSRKKKNFSSASASIAVGTSAVPHIIPINLNIYLLSNSIETQQRAERNKSNKLDIRRNGRRHNVTFRQANNNEK